MPVNMCEEHAKQSRYSLLPNRCKGRCIGASHEDGRTSVALDMPPKPRVDLAR